MVAAKGKSKKKVKAQKSQSLLRGKSLIAPPPDVEYLCFNFKSLDRTQGQTPKDWEENGLLSKFLERLRDLGDKDVPEALNSRYFATYTEFPKKTKFKHPVHIQADAKWARIRLQNKERVIGHLVRNVFFVVFLDKFHEFYITEKKDT